MPIISDKELPPDKRALWLKALSAVELRNYGYAISLIGAVLKESPGFLDGRKMLRKAEIAATKGKKSFLSGLSTASLKGSSMVKKDPLSAMELAEKNLEADPLGAQPNHLLKDAAKAAGYPEVAVFALETILVGSSQDMKIMHELAELLISMGESDKAVEVYNKISEINPQDLVATKRGKDASAQASMKSGGWEQASSYRDLIKNKDEAVSLEQQARVVRSLEMIEQQLAEFMPQWEADQQHVDLSRRIAKLWEERYEQMQDDESLEGAIWYANHLNSVLNGSDPAITRKLSDLQLKRTDAAIKKAEADKQPIEEWLAGDGKGHAEEAKYREHLAEMERHLADLKMERARTMIDESKRRVERNPTDLALRFELGERLLEAGMFNEAIPELQRARQNPNARLRAMSMLGRCFVLKGMLDMATNQFEGAAAEMTAMDVFKKDTLYDLGLVYEKMGKKEDYLRCLKAIMEVDYGYKDVAQRVESSYGG